MDKSEARRLNTEGIGVVCGKVSGNLEVLDFDREGLFAEWLARLKAVDEGLAGLLMEKSMMVSTPSGGGHVYYRCEHPPAGNQKLAVATRPFVDRNGKSKVCLIETRGEGGYVVTPPTPGYRLVSGQLDSLKPLSRSVVDTLHRVSKSFNETDTLRSGNRPGDEYNLDLGVSASSLLEEAGWTRQFQKGDCWHMSRPGKDSGTSATADYNEGGAYVFSTNADIPEGYHSKFDLYARIKHGGDFTAAARELGRIGYGDPPIKRENAPKTAANEKEASALGSPLARVEWGSEGLTEQIDELRYLLETQTREDRSGVHEPIGLMPGGDLGLLVGEGGAGKTWFTVQLAVAIASGRGVFGLNVREVGNVMLLSSEMQADKMRRRFKGALNAAGIVDKAERSTVMNRVFAYAMAEGQSPQLLEKNYGNIKTTAAYDWLTKEAAKRKYSLIIIDPLASFGGPETELNARPFCDYMTKLALGPGSPHVLIVHHSNKGSRGGVRTDATAVRGTSGLTDGPRWQINLERRPKAANQPSFAVLRETKVNDGQEMDGGIWLVRQPEHSGALRRASGSEMRAYVEARSAERDDD